jgi:hypothetical protein
MIHTIDVAKLDEAPVGDLRRARAQDYFAAVIGIHRPETVDPDPISDMVSSLLNTHVYEAGPLMMIEGGFFPQWAAGTARKHPACGLRRRVCARRRAPRGVEFAGPPVPDYRGASSTFMAESYCLRSS